MLDWVRDCYLHMFEHNEKPDMTSLQKDVSEKISKLKDGKLYKYCYFDIDGNYIKDLREHLIYFSQPSKFNDPFDCSLGISASEVVANVINGMISSRLEDFRQFLEDNKDKIKVYIDTNKSMSDDENPFVKVVVDIVRNIDGDADHMTNSQCLSLLSRIMKNNERRREFFELLQGRTSIDFSQYSKEFEFIVLHPELVDRFFTKDAFDFGDSKLSLEESEKVISDVERLGRLLGKDFDTASKRKKFEQQARKLWYDTRNYIDKTFAISCFAECSDSILMWSHYADKHSGFCIEYDLTKCSDIQMIMFVLTLFPVEYTSERPTFRWDAFDYTDPSHIIKKSDRASTIQMMEFLLTKCDIWDYEREWRSIFPAKSLRKQEWSADIISAVYLGANISPENEKKIREATGDKVPVKKYKLDSRKYELKLEE